MKNVLLLMSIVLLISFGCGKKKEKTKAPDLNVETADTVFTSNESENQVEENATKEIAEEKKGQKNEQKTKPKVYKFIPKNRANEYETGDYAVQLISLTNYDKILKIKRQLSDAGYETELSTTTKNGKTFYRLRLSQKYSRESANKIGKEIKGKFKFITSYWVIKTK